MAEKPLKGQFVTALVAEKALGKKIVEEKELARLLKDDPGAAGKFMTKKAAEAELKCSIITEAEAKLRERLQRKYPGLAKRDLNSLVRETQNKEKINRKMTKIISENANKLRKARTSVLCNLGGLIIKAGHDGPIHPKDGLNGLYDREMQDNPGKKFVPRTLGALIYLNRIIKSADDKLLREFHELGIAAYERGKR